MKRRAKDHIDLHELLFGEAPPALSLAAPAHFEWARSCIVNQVGWMGVDCDLLSIGAVIDPADLERFPLQEGHRICRQCGKEFQAQSPSQVYCAVRCRDRHSQAAHRGRARSKRRKDRPGPEPARAAGPLRLTCATKPICLCCLRNVRASNGVIIGRGRDIAGRCACVRGEGPARFMCRVCDATLSAIEEPA